MLDQKLEIWPKRYLEKELDLLRGAGAEFMKVKKLRNSIVHFSSSNTTFEYENVVLHGLADTTDYDALSFEKASSALFVAENLMAEVFLLAGITQANIRHMLHMWAGRIPDK